jgi:hypothetical protein
MKKKVKMIILICFLVTLIPKSESLVAKYSKIKKTTFSDNYHALNIPFENDNNLIYIKVRVNQSEPVWFLIDTGAPLNALDLTFARELKLDLSEKKILSRSKREYFQVNNLILSLPGFEIGEQSAGVLEFQSLWPFSGKKFFGVLGYPFLNEVVLKINYTAKTLSLYDPGHFNYKGEGEHLPLTFNDKPKWTMLPVILHQENKPPVKGKVVLDTGSTMAIVVMRGDLAIKTIENPMYAGIDGTGKGGRLGRIQSIEIGKYLIQNPVAAFPTLGVSKSSGLGTAIKQIGLGLIGSEILSRFNLIFDYQQKILIAEPNVNFKQPHDWDMSGMFLVSSGASFKTFKVFRVATDSPAELAGIQKGDIIIAVNNQSSDRFTLSQIRDLFKQNGKKLTLKIQRGDQVHKITLILKKMI